MTQQEVWVLAIENTETDLPELPGSDGMVLGVFSSKTLALAYWQERFNPTGFHGSAEWKVWINGEETLDTGFRDEFYSLKKWRVDEGWKPTVEQRRV